MDDANDDESVPTRVDEAAPSASTVAAIAASIDIDDSRSTVTAVAYDEPMSTYANANGDEGASTINARPIRVPSESDGDSDNPIAAADASADVDFEDAGTRESAPALPPPPAEHGGGFGSRPSTNNDDVTGVDMPFGGRAQSNVSTIFGDPAGGLTYPPNTWPTGSRLVQTPPGLLAKLRESPKRVAIIGGSAVLCFVLVYMVAFRGSSTPKPTPAPSEPPSTPAVQQPAVQQPPVEQPEPASAPDPVVDTGSAAPAPVDEPPAKLPPTTTPPPVTPPKTVVKKPAATTKPAAVVKKPPTTTTTAATKSTKSTKTTSTTKKPTPTTKPKKPAWDPNSLFPTKRK